MPVTSADPLTITARHCQPIETWLAIWTVAMGIRSATLIPLILSASLVDTPTSDAAKFVPLGDLSGGYFNSVAIDVSANGSVVVGVAESSSGSEAFRWTGAGGMVGLGDLPGGSFYSFASGVSADGSVVVGESQSASGREAFRWTGSMVGLGDLSGGGFFSRASGVSADGSVVVGEGLSDASSPAPKAFRWTVGGGMTGLGDLPGGAL